MAEVNLKLARHNRLAGKWKNTILGAEQFGAQVLRPAKGKAFHYRLYLQREGDGKQIDLMRSGGGNVVSLQRPNHLLIGRGWDQIPVAVTVPCFSFELPGLTGTSLE